jgi:hypothetical protein
MSFAFTACKEKEPEYDIYENHSISACGINDPLINFEWLAEFIAENAAPTRSTPSYNYNISIELYSNNETQDNYIVILLHLIKGGENSKFESVDEYSLKEIYTCEGKRLFVDSTGATDTNAWKDFFNSGKNTSQGVIWSRKEVI